jgi:hypothetical protein
MRHVVAGLYVLALIAAAASGLDSAYLLVALLLALPLAYLLGKSTG